MTRMMKKKKKTITGEGISIEADSILYIDFAEWEGQWHTGQHGYLISMATVEIDEAYSSADAK